MDAATDTSPKAKVCLLGLGGGALRVLERLRPQFENEVDLIGIDTDARELDRVSGIQTLRLGRSLLRGLGCGGDEEMGRLAVDGDRAEIARTISGYELILIVGCLGRGFASGALPGIAGLAGQTGAPTVVVVSSPFQFEGKRPAGIARKALAETRRSADCLIELPNDLLFQEAGESDRADQLFEASDEWIARAVSAAVGPFLRPGPLSVDLATFRSALKGDESRMHFSTCRVALSEGTDGVAKALLNCPFRSAGMERISADRLLVSIGSGGSLTTDHFSSLARSVTALFDADEEAVFGLWDHPELGDQIEVTVFARTNLVSDPRSRLPEKVVVHKSKLGLKNSKKGKEKIQTEFDALLEHNERGLFGRLDVDAYNGVDLDKPTFLRKGIKIPMPKG